MLGIRQILNVSVLGDFPLCNESSALLALSPDSVLRADSLTGVDIGSLQSGYAVSEAADSHVVWSSVGKMTADTLHSEVGGVTLAYCYLRKKVEKTGRPVRPVPGLVLRMADSPEKVRMFLPDRI